MRDTSDTYTHIVLKQGGKPGSPPRRRRAPPPLGRGQVGARPAGRKAPSAGPGAGPPGRAGGRGREGRRGGAGRVGSARGRRAAAGPQGAGGARACRGRGARGAAAGTAEVRREPRRAAEPEAEGAEPRSQLPPGLRAQAEDTRPRPGTHRAHSLSKQCSEAPGGAAGCWATGGEAGGARPRGEPATLSPNPVSFCLANAAAEGSSGAAGSALVPERATPLSASPGVTGGRWRRVERPDRVRPGVVLQVGGAEPGAHGSRRVFWIHSRIALF